MKRHLKIIILSILIIGIINFQIPYGIEKTKGMINSQEMVKQDWSMTLGGIKDDVSSIIIKLLIWITFLLSLVRLKDSNI